MYTAYYKIKDIINSCNLLSQLACCKGLVERFRAQYDNETLAGELEEAIDIKQSVLEVNNAFELV